ncbi:hypothetical protein B0T19DRAFT_417458, partial [Cercophora scortea]
MVYSRLSCYSLLLLLMLGFLWTALCAAREGAWSLGSGDSSLLLTGCACSPGSPVRQFPLTFVLSRKVAAMRGGVASSFFSWGLVGFGFRDDL